MKNIKGVKFGAVLRIVLQVLAYINQFLIIVGQSPLGDNPIYIWTSFGVLIATTLISYWYNNDWSKMAKLIGRVFKLLEDGKITEDEIKDLLKTHGDEEDTPK